MKKSEAQFHKLLKEFKRGALLVFAVSCFLVGFFDLTFEALRAADAYFTPLLSGTKLHMNMEFK